MARGRSRTRRAHRPHAHNRKRAMEDLEEEQDVTAWVNGVLSEASADGASVDAKISSVSMKLQIMAADLNDELEGHMEELIEAASGICEAPRGLGDGHGYCGFLHAAHPSDSGDEDGFVGQGSLIGDALEGHRAFQEKRRGERRKLNGVVLCMFLVLLEPGPVELQVEISAIMAALDIDGVRNVLADSDLFCVEGLGIVVWPARRRSVHAVDGSVAHGQGPVVAIIITIVRVHGDEERPVADAVDPRRERRRRTRCWPHAAAARATLLARREIVVVR